MKTCPRCGMDFASIHENQVYCSTRCATAAYRKRQTERNNPRIEMECAICGKTSKRHIITGGGRESKTCGSQACVKAWKKQCNAIRCEIYRKSGKVFASTLKAREESKARKPMKDYLAAMIGESRFISKMIRSLPSIKSCLTCGKEFADYTNKKHCSSACRERAKFIKSPMHHFCQKAIYAQARRMKQHGSVDGKRKRQLIEAFGYSPSQFKQHIESTFEEGMSWDNYGREGWHIDHIMPASVFDHSTEQGIRKCFALSNLMARWATNNIAREHGSAQEGNIQKRNKIALDPFGSL